MNFSAVCKNTLLTTLVFTLPYSPLSSTYLEDEKLVTQNKEIIVLDPGHAKHAEKEYRGKHYKGLKEEEMTLEMANNIKPLLEELGYEVYLTRTGDSLLNKNNLDVNNDGEITVRDELILRTNFADSLDADYFLSLHFNYAPSKPSYSGMEVYFFGARNKSDLNNNKTEYVFPRHCKIRSDSSMNFAKDFSNYMNKKGWKSKYMGADFRVLKEQPADYTLLIEFAYLTNTNDRWKVDSETDRQKLAEMVADFFKQRKNNLLVSLD